MVFSELLKNFVKLIEKSDDLKIIKTIAKQICLENFLEEEHSNKSYQTKYN